MLDSFSFSTTVSLACQHAGLLPGVEPDFRTHNIQVAKLSSRADAYLIQATPLAKAGGEVTFHIGDGARFVRMTPLASPDVAVDREVLAVRTGAASALTLEKSKGAVKPWDQLVFGAGILGAAEAKPSFGMRAEFLANPAAILNGAKFLIQSTPPSLIASVRAGALQHLTQPVRSSQFLASQNRLYLLDLAMGLYAAAGAQSLEFSHSLGIHHYFQASLPWPETLGLVYFVNSKSQRFAYGFHDLVAPRATVSLSLSPTDTAELSQCELHLGFGTFGTSHFSLVRKIDLMDFIQKSVAAGSGYRTAVPFALLQDAP